MFLAMSYCVTFQEGLDNTTKVLRLSCVSAQNQPEYVPYVGFRHDAQTSLLRAKIFTFCKMNHTMCILKKECSQLANPVGSTLLTLYLASLHSPESIEIIDPKFYLQLFPSCFVSWTELIFQDQSYLNNPHGKFIFMSHYIIQSKNNTHK